MELTNRKGVGLMAVGMLLLAVSLFLALHYVMDEWRSSGYASSALAVMEEAEASGTFTTGENGEPAVQANGKLYIGTLTIPALEMEMPILEKYDFHSRKMGPSLYYGSPEGDRMVIGGYNFQGHFAPLKKLSAGDEVLYTTLEGKTLRYQVASTEILKPSQVEEMVGSGYGLTLFTSTTGGNSRLAIRYEALR